MSTNISPEELLILASGEVDPDDNPGNPNWREAPVVGLTKPSTAKIAEEYELPNRLLTPPFHFLGGTWEDNATAKERFKRLANSPWKVVDVETSGRTPYSVQVRTKDKDMGKLRCRIISATWANPDGGVESAAWDLDTMENSEKVALAKSCLTNTFLAHNAAFDLGWLLSTVIDGGGTVTDKLWPKQVLCTLHLGRQLYPENRRDLRIAANNASDSRQEWIKNRLLKDRGMENWGSSLADMTYSLNLPWIDTLDKSYQKPSNWVLRAPLSPGHYNYVKDDAILPAVVVHRLLEGGPVKSTEMLSKEELMLGAAKYLSENHDKLKSNPKLTTYFNVHHDAIKHVVNISTKGMPFDLRLSEKYKAGMQDKLNLAVEGINDINYPHLVAIKDILKDPAVGLTQDIIDIWLKTFRQADPNARIPRTNAGEYSLSAKDLRKNRLDKGDTKEVYELLTVIQRSKQAIKMITNLEQFVVRAFNRFGTEYATGVLDRGIARLHPLLGFGPGTDRLSSNDPNAQNFPRDPNFRALVRARPGHKIISADYGQIELRIAAGLALRAQDEWNTIFKDPNHTEPTKIGERAVRQLKRLWEALEQGGITRSADIEAKMSTEEKQWDNILKNKLAEFNRNDVSNSPDSFDASMPHSAPVSSDLTYQQIKDERDIRRLMVYACRIFTKRHQFGTDMYGALAIAFREGIDPHLFTGIAMAQHGGKDIGGPDPLSVIRAAKAAGKEAVEALKQKFKKERNNAKAVNFGLLYGMTPPTLHMTGVVSYGSDWSEQEAVDASDAWFGLYPEIGFWQYFTILRPEWEGVAQVCKTNKRQGTAKVADKEIRSWRVESLYGRTYVREAFREALNYQDQGTGAHMVFRAMSLATKDVKACLIDQIHDEILCEVPDDQVDKVLKGLVGAMEKAGKEALGKYNIPVEAEAEIGEVWMHGDPPTIPLDPDAEFTADIIAQLEIPEEEEEGENLGMGV